MTLRSRILAPIAAGLACAPAVVWAQADALQHDPFARPVLSKPAPVAVRGPDAAAAAPQPPWRPELSAVLVAGPKSAVNINGSIVRIGDVIDGHRLVEVHEQSAVFVKNRARVTLALRSIEVTPGAAPPPPAPPAPAVQPVAQPAPPRPEAK